MWFFFTVSTGTFILYLSPVSYISRHPVIGQFIELFHLTSWQLYWCSKTMKWQPFWCAKNSCRSWVVWKAPIHFFSWLVTIFHWPILCRVTCDKVFDMLQILWDNKVTVIRQDCASQVQSTRLSSIFLRVQPFKGFRTFCFLFGKV